MKVKSPYVKKELNSPLPSDPNSNEKRTLNLSPVSKLSPGGQFKQIYTESPSVPGPSPQNYSQNQDNQNNFNKGEFRSIIKLLFFHLHIFKQISHIYNRLI